MSSWSGSSYKGPIKDGWFEGFGTYTYPNGVRYEGEFSRGEFHGKGTLVYPNGGKYKATWERGKMLEGEYEYYDGLKYDFDNWNYCTPNDRRFYTEIKEGLRPAGDTLIVNQAEGPKKIPPGTYDVGEGYYDPVPRRVYDYEHVEMFTPDDAEIAWIVSQCRYNPAESEDLTDDEAVLPSPPSEEI
mmetsp:Transcript_1675/g.3587  ORF Transcript_1675/g.3587 Transcript_1675/m.3587 type:complete len:186 (+) Transcript_1675:225-782(+)|eukprot:CAMPEP_0204908098 /NCGR_PEP_ID=MMETSP1397-20131031/7110_1 /ASSEMBLY_ACC=CAM_ASM_000891 /TAXON_ID=49980 /ORGANISM="Climacostomum Climacostomum virens, Strain Stock W-24" /LENGTH=185 /DNA_ID=CAMNT_0052077481 /DNA_START=52 /DNA_END=609 /DNA_ORIENTATION=+